MARRITIKVMAVFVLTILAVSFPVSAAVTLVKNGEPAAAIVLPDNPENFEQTAANELVNHLEIMTGARLEVTTAGDVPRDMLPIYIGSAAAEELDALTRDEGVNPSSFTLRVQQDRVDIRGLSDEGTMFGAYELLEQVGFRWYTLGDVGRVVPQGNSVELDIQTNSQAPSVVFRRLQHVPDRMPWARRARIGGESRSTGQHGIPGLPRGDFSENPEWYSLTGGQRRARQDCLSNPEVLERATEGIRRAAEAQGGDVQYVGAASHDGGGYCQCDGCKALDQGVYDPFGDRESMTDRYIWFFNRVLENLEDEFPNLRIVHYTYAAHMMPPAIEMNTRIVPVFAPITLERLRGMDNPMGVDRHPLRWLIDEYAERGVTEMYYRGYFGNLACLGFPWSQLDRVRNDIPALIKQGVSVFRVETIWPTWCSNFLNWYVAARLWWNIDTDVDALLDEFYALYYGPAEDVMREFHEKLESAFADTPYFTGSTYLYFPIFMDHPRRDALRGLLDDAAVKAGEVEDGIYGERISAMRYNWDRMDMFLDMMLARNRHDFVTAHSLMEAYNEKTAWGTEKPFSYEHEGYEYGRDGRYLIWRERPDLGGSYFNRFFRRPIVSGYERAVEKGEIVATMPDEWMFLIDPAEIGRISGYHRPGQLGGNWQPILTSSRSWSDQGLHYYKGLAWYRQTVTIPEEFEGRPIYAWFGGVDRTATVWINGVSMGSNAEPREGLPGIPGSFRPFDLPTVDEDSESVLNFGGENWVVVEIENRSLAELGTGGILAPVMFWSPKDPDWVPGQ